MAIREGARILHDSRIDYIVRAKSQILTWNSRWYAVILCCNPNIMEAHVYRCGRMSSMKVFSAGSRRKVSRDAVGNVEEEKGRRADQEGKQVSN
jgi:hypothetical protein